MTQHEQRVRFGTFWAHLSQRSLLGYSSSGTSQGLDDIEIDCCVVDFEYLTSLLLESDEATEAGITKIVEDFYSTRGDQDQL